MMVLVVRTEEGTIGYYTTKQEYENVTSARCQITL